METFSTRRYLEPVIRSMYESNKEAGPGKYRLGYALPEIDSAGVLGAVQGRGSIVGKAHGLPAQRQTLGAQPLTSYTIHRSPKWSALSCTHSLPA